MATVAAAVPAAGPGVVNTGVASGHSGAIRVLTPSSLVPLSDCLFTSNNAAIAAMLASNSSTTSLSSSLTSTGLAAGAGAGAGSSQHHHGGHPPVFSPPTTFAFVEEKLCRALGPIKQSMFAFLDSINVGTIVNLSGEALDSVTMDFLSESNIRLVSDLSLGSTCLLYYSL
jgi:hypothetical protein